MPTYPIELVVLALAWSAYFVLHSWLASLAVKRRVALRRPGWMAGYRLTYNLLALLAIVPLLYWTHRLRGHWLWRWEGGWAWLANGLALAAIAGFLWSLRYYDSGEFLGLKQLQRRQQAAEDQEHLQISPLHRYVRHPWYSLGLVILWTRDMEVALLVTALVTSTYILIGSHFEERKLLVYHGEIYRQYRTRVPALLPRPWRRLAKADAERLMQGSIERQRNSPRRS